MSTDSSARKMKLLRGNAGKDAEIARLQQELDEVQSRLDEVTSYYRGELESSQQRLQQESVRSQANEVARRRRAEEQVAYLKGELKAAQSEAEHAKRRYHELYNRLETLEKEAEKQARQEVDKFRSAASTAWKSAEEEMEKLDQELAENQRELAREQERNRQLQESLKREQSNVGLEKAKVKQAQLAGRQAIDKLRRALKASEQRRQQLDRNLQAQIEAGVVQETSAEQRAAMDRSGEQLRAVYDAFRSERAESAPEAERPRLPKEDNTVYLDLASIDLGSALKGELSEEFMLLPSDDSIYKSADRDPAAAGSGGGDEEFIIDTGPEAEAEAETPAQTPDRPSSPASASEPERTAEKQGPASAAKASPAAAAPQPAPTAPREMGDEFGGGSRLGWYAAAATAVVVILGGGAYLLLA